ncbi:DUF2735 domain-containing protein [Neorhizobium sp. JUb45]|uniref:DUF2735 domain-containing protein n=1 Tax=unclassified Neorhizobium TaxID=2629175 RepID=UPI001049E865|nr:DUF2735 domain-containing protein [Neorhizobium sp. JUb45]TCR06169.1 uncharacterized protein DUF2735 [Neorhizobium sp. JUb45]
MTTNFERQTATVLQFPVGGRAAWRAAGTSRILTPTAPDTGPSVAFSDLAFGGSWYHEEALHDDEPKPILTN